VDDYPISQDQAKKLLSGDLGNVYRDILAGCCIPICWFKFNTNLIMHNGTVTIVQTPQKILGITAAHVLRQYQNDLKKEGSLRVQLMNEVIDDLPERIIDVCDNLDIATFTLDEMLVKRLGKTPLGVWSPKPPQEGRGIMIAGFPAVERLELRDSTISFGLFTAIGIARTVTDKQITWYLEREYQVEQRKIPTMPPEYNLGGVSGGPLISWFESENFVTHPCLSGIVIEHPDYTHNNADNFPTIERLIAIRADSITESGKIGMII
jgi:hypothetical protein